jgi:hypothetical protein
MWIIFTNNNENQRAPGIMDRNYRGKYLQLQFTVDDEGAFTMPWSATITYGRGLTDWPESVCAENTQFYPGKNAAVPTADKFDFWAADLRRLHAWINLGITTYVNGAPMNPIQPDLKSQGGAAGKVEADELGERPE